jgi:hypothetical protein
MDALSRALKAAEAAGLEVPFMAEAEGLGSAPLAVVGSGQLPAMLKLA